MESQEWINGELTKKEYGYYIEGEDEFYGSEAFGKLYEYFMDSGEMPYGVAKARTECPDDWILEQIELLNEDR